MRRKLEAVDSGEFEDIVVEILNDILWSNDKVSDSQWEVKMYADYREELGDHNLKSIFNSNYPMETFYEIIDEAYWDARSYEYDALQDQVEEQLMERFNGEIDFDDYDIITILEDHVYFVPPYDHYLDENVKVNIFIDTGDANYDFTLNGSIPPCYGADEDSVIDDKASLVWLTKQQGYSKEDLYFNNMDGNRYLESVYQELENHSSNIATLVFLTRMSVGELIKVQEAVKSGSGSITLDKSTMCGLFDPYYGGGSVLEIELVKDVTIPFSIIWDIAPDGAGKGYSVDEVYGLVGSAWGDNVKSINA